MQALPCFPARGQVECQIPNDALGMYCMISRLVSQRFFVGVNFFIDASGVFSVGSYAGAPMLSGSRAGGMPDSKRCSGNVLYDLSAGSLVVIWDTGLGVYAGGGPFSKALFSENISSFRRGETGETGVYEVGVGGDCELAGWRPSQLAHSLRRRTVQ